MPSPTSVLTTTCCTTSAESQSTVHIRGRIVDANGVPVAGAEINAFDQSPQSSLDDLNPLPHASPSTITTSSTGCYEIEVTVPRIAALVIRATKTGWTAPLDSAAYFQATGELCVDLVTGTAPYRGPSEVEQVVALAQSTSSIAPADITPVDVKFIAGRTGLDPNLVAFAIKAYVHNASHSAVSANAFYAMFRAGLSTDLDDLLAQGEAAWRRALQSSVDAHYVPAMTSTEIDTAVSALIDIQVTRAVTAPSSGSNLRTLLDHSGLITAQLTDVVQRFVTRTGSVADFWEDIVAHYDAATATKLQFILQIGALTGNHEPLVSNVMAGYGTTFTTFKDLVSLNAAGWKTRIDATGGPPSSVTATDDMDASTRYARLLAQMVEEAFPTPVIAARIAAESPPVNADMVTFFANCTDFDIDTHVVSQYLASPPPALSGANIPQLTADLEKLQRVTRVLPRFERYEQARVLLADGIDSAAAIASMGAAAFMARYGSHPVVGRNAAEIFHRATAAASAALAISANHAAAFGDVKTPVFGGRPTTVTDFPDYASLFGSVDYCDCPDCRSVNSPAAYLVDALHFLEKRDATGGGTVLSKLTARRPDLPLIKLTCENTNTVVPYIDLVNEVLEEAVHPSGSADRQTEGEQADLALEPEHLNAAAYSDLRSQVFPWSLPFDLWLEQSRMYLRHLGAEPVDLMRAMQSSASVPSADQIAAEQLGMTPVEFATIAASTVDNTTNWGLATDEDPSKVPTFLEKSGLAFENLAALFNGWFVNPTGNIAVTRPEGICSLEDATIDNLDAAALHRIHRFVRLQRRLGWSFADLDRAIRGLNGNPSSATSLALNATVLNKLAELVRLQRELGLSAEDVVTWVAPLGTFADQGPSQYDRLFQNPSVLNPLDAALELIEGTRPTELNTTGGQISANAASVTAGLGISGPALSALLQGAVPNVMNLANLTALHRRAVLARALGLSIDDLLRLASLSQLDPFDVATGGARAFVHEARAMVGPRGLSLAEVDYLLHQHEQPGDDVMPALEAIVDAIERVHRRVAGVASDESSRRQAAVTEISAQLHLASDLLEDITLAALTLGGVPVMEMFTAETFVTFADPITVETLSTFPSQRDAYYLLHKTALLIHRFAMQPGDARSVIEDLADVWLNISALGGTATYAQLASLRDVFVLRDELIRPGMAFCDLIAKAVDYRDNGYTSGDFDAFGKLLSTRLKDKLDDGVALFEPFGFSFPDSFCNDAAFRRLHDALSLCRRIGAGAGDVLTWAAGMVDPSTAQATAHAVRRAARARHTEASWAAAARPMRDELRERQRAALVASVSHALGVSDPESLFAHYLVDPEMCACGETSRIKQAIGSVQTFVQRALMNLETNVQLSAADAREWAWMKSYRVWEANRKVFLYPENWLDPSLRSDKTPFFVEFESALQQNEARADTVPNAFADYLGKLESIARLEVFGTCYEQDDAAGGAPDVLHVFARTHVTPRKHFYRRYVDGEGWTPWEGVELDIKDSTIVPVVFNRRLHVFWPETAPRGQEQTTSLSQQDAVPPPPKLIDVRLAHSEYRNDRWLPKKLSDVVVTLHGGENGTTDVDTAARELFFRTGESDGDLVIMVWSVDHRDGESHGYRELAVVTVRDGVGPMELAPPASPYWAEGQILEPSGTIALGPSYRYLVSDGRLDLPFVDPAGSSYDVNTLTGAQGYYTLTVPPQYAHFPADVPVFYQDRDRTLFITRRRVASDDVADMLRTPTAARPDGIDLALHTYLNPAGVPPPAGALRGLPGSVVVRTVTENQVKPRTILGQAMRPRVQSAIEVLPHNLLPLMVTGEEYPIPEGSYAPDETPVGHATRTLGEGEYVAGIDAAASVPSIISPTTRSANVLVQRENFRYQFETFYHPYVRDIARQFNRFGIAGMLVPPDGSDVDLDRQQKAADFFTAYEPNTDVVLQPYPRDEIDFAPDGAYAAYNWELFLYAPFLIAERLRANRQFEEAQRWYHFIFDPTSQSTDAAPQRYWRVKPLFDEAGGASIEQLLNLLHVHGTSDAQRIARERMEQQIALWRKKPFDPNVIARFRPVAFQKAVVMRYLDNLIEWGDDLFRRDTIESINEATQLYLLAAQILGDRPVRLPEQEVTAKSYAQISAPPGLDAFSNAVVRVEHYLPPAPRTQRRLPRVDLAPGVHSPSLLAGVEMYFCIPPNDQLLAYWDRVADRLFKIRHCMNLEGVARTLPLFEPPIDPGLLVRAAAQGISIGSALADLEAPAPLYRYSVLYQRAVELCNDVRSLGQALLSALEKRDSEELAAIRSTHEIRIADAVRRVREQQVEDAKASKVALERSREVVQSRKAYYEGLAKNGLNAEETEQLSALEDSQFYQLMAQDHELIASILAIIPEFDVGVSGYLGTPVSKLRFGGSNLHAMIQAGTHVFNMLASAASHESNVAAIQAGHARRAADWAQQVDAATKELSQIEAQITAAEIRIAVAERERDVQDEQLELAHATDEHLQGKFTRTELYDWMSTELTGLYTRAYQLAFDLAKRAEKAWERELGEFDSNRRPFIRMGYWEDRRSGLLAGDRLLNDLRRMEASYLEKNKREFEITKHISLAQLDPVALIALRKTGTCAFKTHAVLFDLDFPGHYLRRIKNVAITMPGVTGPYTSVPCTATLSSNQFKLADGSIQSNLYGASSIVTSTAQNDTGLFETNLHDERYLPFEGQGVVGDWTISLPADLRQFDYDTIADVVITLRYTARIDGRDFTPPTTEDIATALDAIPSATAASVAGGTPLGRFRAFSLRHDFPDQWEAFLHPATGASAATLPITKDRFPFVAQGSAIDIHRIYVVMPLEAGATLSSTPSSTEAAKLTVGTTTDVSVDTGSSLGGIPHAVVSLTSSIGPGDLPLTVTEINTGIAASTGTNRVDPDKVRDVIVIVQYQRT